MKRQQLKYREIEIAAKRLLAVDATYSFAPGASAVMQQNGVAALCRRFVLRTIRLAYRDAQFIKILPESSPASASVSVFALCNVTGRRDGGFFIAKSQRRVQQTKMGVDSK